jgi:ribosome-associated protein
MQDEDHDDGLGGRSRDRREFAQDNQRWARRMVALEPAVFAHLPLLEVIVDEVALARTLKDGRARNRSLRRIDMLVSGLTPEEVARVDAFLDTPPLDADEPRIEAWFERLLREGDEAVSALAAEFPNADLQQLRQMLRNTKKAALAGRARQHLREWLLAL